jgi:hypothetical protein
MHDALYGGRRFRTFTVLDEANREALGIAPPPARTQPSRLAGTAEGAAGRRSNRAKSTGVRGKLDTQGMCKGWRTGAGS